ncbi:hypothetical protein [Vogesella fluminis]|uniref:hypothetical protein n=1 Tax=Vogesella fluminis TaxID=1069161 RepID=UPI001671F34A|nr:hypothetical protein [Vogesella fluminis]
MNKLTVAHATLPRQCRTPGMAGLPAGRKIKRHPAELFAGRRDQDIASVVLTFSPLIVSH